MTICILLVDYYGMLTARGIASGSSRAEANVEIVGEASSGPRGGGALSRTLEPDVAADGTWA